MAGCRHLALRSVAGLVMSLSATAAMAQAKPWPTTYQGWVAEGYSTVSLIETSVRCGAASCKAIRVFLQRAAATTVATPPFLVECTIVVPTPGPARCSVIIR